MNSNFVEKKKKKRKFGKRSPTKVWCNLGVVVNTNNKVVFTFELCMRDDYKSE